MMSYESNKKMYPLRLLEEWDKTCEKFQKYYAKKYINKKEEQNNEN